MSYPNDEWPEDQWRAEAVSRMQELGALAEEAGIILLVENCSGWASTSAENYGRYFELVNSPAVKAVYDTGNPASHGHTDTWGWYQAAKPHIGYLHIKAHTTGEGGEHVWPDAGESCVVETLKDLFLNGYSGFISIEPHMKAIVHEGREITNEEAAFETFVEYGRRLEALVASIR